MNTIADRIKWLRGTTSRRAFANKLDIQESTLRNYEAGSSLPNADLLQNICKKLRIHPVWLLMGEGPMWSKDLQSSEPQTRLMEKPTESIGQCARCAKMEEKIERLEDERRELNTENRGLWKKNEQLIREIAELREVCATLKERQKHCSSAPLLQTPQPIIPSSETGVRT